MSKRPKERQAPPARPANARALRRSNAAVADGAGARYPQARDVLASPGLLERVRAGMRLAATAGGALALTALSSGCAEPPQCSADRMGEVSAHGQTAASRLFGLEFNAAFEELGTGLGIVPHPATPMIAGAMPMPGPYLGPGGLAEDPLDGPELTEDPLLPEGSEEAPPIEL